MATTEVKFAKIYRGSKKRFTIDLDRDDDPWDLSTNDEITVCFPSESGSPQTVTKSGGEVTILNATLGKIQVDVPASKTTLMKVGEEQTIEVQVVDVPSGDPEITQIEGCLNVIASLK